jgi:hypothetical protein
MRKRTAKEWADKLVDDVLLEERDFPVAAVWRRHAQKIIQEAMDETVRATVESMNKTRKLS